MKPEEEAIIKKLGLINHPEGGYYKQIFKSNILINVKRPEGEVKRSSQTKIYYFLSSGEFSAWHRLPYSNETWHHHEGSITIHMIHEDKRLEQIKLGDPSITDQISQFIVPPNVWFAASVNDSDSYALVSCTVTPGFDFADFEMGIREKLLAEYPEHEELIKRFTR